MKHSQIIFPAFLAILIGIITMSFNPAGQCDSPVVGGHTGAPGETGCNGCHAGIPNTGAATIDFDLGTATYVPGQTYTGYVRIQQPGFDKFGFSCLALKNSDNTTTGSFALVETIRTRTYADGNRNYVSHTPCGADSADANSWNFTWTAPSVNVDTITLYLGALVANHNHATSGDFGYTRSIILTPQNVNSVAETKNQNAISVFPNPVDNHLSITIAGLSSNVRYSIVNTSGQVLTEHSVAANNGKFTADISSLSNAIYFIKIETESGTFISKFIKY